MLPIPNWLSSQTRPLCRSATDLTRARPRPLPLSARLWRRSCAVVRGAGALLLFEPGAGSLAVAGFAVGRGLPVVAFGAVPPGAPRGCEGSWESRRLVFPCWGWVPAADQLSLWGEVEAPATSSPLALS